MQRIFSMSSIFPMLKELNVEMEFEHFGRFLRDIQRQPIHDFHSGFEQRFGNAEVKIINEFNGDFLSTSKDRVILAAADSMEILWMEDAN